MAILRAEKIIKSFGGLKVTNCVSFDIQVGELSSIIGPNGAGKTTLFNLLTGRIRPDSGELFFKDHNITNLASHDRCRMGLGRSFQRVNIFPKLSVFDNIQAAALSIGGERNNLFSSAKNMFSEEVEDILEKVELSDKKRILGGTLSYGDQKRLEIGVTLAGKPELLLLDEPTAGMSLEETSGIVKLIKMLAQDTGMTIVFVEHDMNVVLSISEKVRVLHMGTIIFTGTPEEAKVNDEVQRIYLGEVT